MTKKARIETKSERIIRSAHSPRMRVAKTFTEPSLTKQSFRDEVNINSIMKRFTSTGVFDHLNNSPANYTFCTGDDFRESIETLDKSRASFLELPSHIREKFNNDPGKFLDFVQNPENRPEMYELGLLRDTLSIPTKDASESLSDALNGQPTGDGDPDADAAGAGTVTT